MWGAQVHGHGYHDYAPFSADACSQEQEAAHERRAAFVRRGQRQAVARRRKRGRAAETEREAPEEGGVFRADPAPPAGLRADVAESEGRQTEVPDECGHRQALQPDDPLKDDAVRAILDMMWDEPR